MARARTFSSKLEESVSVCSGMSTARRMWPHSTGVQSAKDNDHAQAEGITSSAFLQLEKESFPQRRTWYGSEEERRKARNLGKWVQGTQSTLRSGEREMKLHGAMAVEEIDYQPQLAESVPSVRSQRSARKQS